MFLESGTARYAPNCDAPPTVQTPLISYSATFTIFTADAVVRGTETKRGSALVTISGSAGGSGVTVGPVRTAYTATITTAHRICTAAGTSTATVSQALGSGNWYASLADGPLRSTRPLVCH